MTKKEIFLALGLKPSITIESSEFKSGCKARCYL